MTPLDRYRKHYLMFDYWNDELIEGLQANPPLNPKRLKRASTEALTELTTLKDLVSDDLAVRIIPLIETRAKIDRQLQSESVSASQVTAIWRVLESQARQVQREFSWRDVEDQLKAPRSAQDAQTD